MAGSNGFDGDGPMATINVTPLVDVMLVLLVIFMITAPMMQQGVQVDLPKASTKPLPGSNEQVVISVDKTGAMFLGAGNPLDLRNLPEKITAVMQTRKEDERKVYIKADTALSYGRIMEIMAELHKANITQIGLISAPAGQAEEEKKKS